jgi:hypothetical protein
MNFNNGSDLVFQTQVSAGGTPQCTMFINGGSQSVGIGTANPAARLSVVQDITTTAEFGSFGQFTVQGATNSSKLLSFGFNTATDVGFIQAMVNGTSYNNLLLNARGGNVGIGTICPGKILNIAANDATSGNYQARSAVIRIQNTNDVGANSRFAGVQFSFSPGASTGDNYVIGAVGAVLTDSSTQWSGDLVFAVKNATTATTLTEYARIFTGGVTCFTCQVCTPSGVKFGSGASTLNYYEQGTWTPRLTNGSFTSNAGTENAAWYVRVGNIVTVGGTLSWSGGSGAQDGNSLRIACLPFASNNTANYRSVGQFGAPATDSIGFKNACSQMVLVVDPGASFI